MAGGSIQAFVKTARREFHSLEGAAEEERLVNAIFHLDVLADLKRISSHITAVAYPILEGV